MTDRRSIEARIAELKGELERAEGRPTEVYSRIVGYYRSVRNWNAGKREEYGQRLVYGMPAAVVGAKEAPSAREAPPQAPPQAAAETAQAQPPKAAVFSPPEAASVRDGVLVFTREACPNCSPVANYVMASGIKALFVDVDREEGLALARDLGVMATPTVLGMDGEGKESFRAFDVQGLSARLENTVAGRT